MSDVTVLPDGSAFLVMSFPLPADHWLTVDGYNNPPMPFRMGSGEERTRVADDIRAAAKYAIRASTNNGKEQDFDPDAMVQNFIVGMLGYWTEDGLSEPLFNPDPVPPEWKDIRARQAVLVEALRDAVAALGGIRSDNVPDSVRDVLSQIAMTQMLDATSAALAQGVKT